MKKLILILLFIILSSFCYSLSWYDIETPIFAFSIEYCYVDKDCEWYSVITEQPNYYDTTSANITINNVTHQMEMLQKGIFKYNNTYNESGILLGCTQFYNNSLVGTYCETKQIKEDNMTTWNFLAIFIALMFFIWVLKFVYEQFKEKYGTKTFLIIFMLMTALLIVFSSVSFLNGNSTEIGMDLFKQNVLYLFYIFVACGLSWAVIYFVMFLARYFGWNK